MDKQAGDFVQGVENQGVPPHDNSDGIVAVCKTVGADEEAFGSGEGPNGKQAERIDEIAEVGEEIVIALAMVGVESDRHEIYQLGSEPIVEILWDSTYQVSTDEDVEDGGNE